MRHRLTYLLLLFLANLSRLFYRFEWHWVGEVPEHPWRRDFRLVAILNHTSLFEFILSGGTPNRFLKRLAYHGVVPVAAKTIDRPIIGKFWRLVAKNVIPISRERDETWQQVLSSVDPQSMVIILPEGRMKRANGLDVYGKPMTVRGGIVDLLEAIGEGEMLFAYNEGIHHVQAPGELLPRLFKTVRMRLEVIDVARYREAMGSSDPDYKAYRRRVIEDLTARRDRYCVSDFDVGGCQLDPANTSR